MSGGVAKTSLFLRLNKKRRRERYEVRDDMVPLWITDLALNPKNRIGAQRSGFDPERRSSGASAPAALL